MILHMVFLAGTSGVGFTLSLVIMFAAERSSACPIVGYDGGDCCEETCVDNTYVCGVDGFDCVDPDHVDDPEGSYSFSFSFPFGCQEDKILSLIHI